MPKSKRVAPLEAAAVLDWMGVRAQRVEHGPAATIFAQGDPATSVMYAEHGIVWLSVLSYAGKEVEVAVLDAGHFFGEGCNWPATGRSTVSTRFGRDRVQTRPSATAESTLQQHPRERPGRQRPAKGE